jgi:O-antigen/teichoic acid export membrane protein
MLIRQTALYLPAQLIGPGFQFVAAVVWTHWLAPDAYGVLAYVLALQELASVSCLLWWSQFMLRHIQGFSGREERARYQRAENVVLLASALAQVLVSIGVLAAMHVRMTTPLVIATSLYTVARTIVMHVAERARAEERIGLYTTAQLVGPIAGFAIGLALVEGVAATPASAIGGLAVANIAVLAGLWIWMGLGLSVAAPDRAILARAISFGAPLVVSGAIAWASPNGIRVIVDHFQGATAVGLVSVGWGLGQRFASVMAMTVTTAAFPLAVGHLRAGRRAEALEQISLNAAILFGLMAPATAGVLLLTPDLVHLAIAPTFRASTLAILPIAALAGSVRNFRMHYCDQVFLLFEQTKTTVVIAAVEAVVTLALCWAGLIWGGLAGAAFGCLIGAILAALYCLILAMVRNQLPIPGMHMARILAATAIMAGALRLVPWDAAPVPLLVRMIAEAILGIVVYALGLAALYPGESRKGARWLRAFVAPLARGSA